MVSPFLGQISAVGFNFAPRGWALCDGQLLPIASNTALFSLLGTAFGGDGRTTFALPDLRGRTMRGVGNGAGLDSISWGERGGTNSIVITTSHMPSHNHTLYAGNALGNSQQAPNAVLAGASQGENATGQPSGSKGDFIYQTGVNGTNAMNSTSIGNTGGTQPINIDSPYLGIYQCIALQGVFPSRS